MSTYRDKLCRTCGYFRLFGKQYLNLRESTLSNNSFHRVLCVNCGFGVNALWFGNEKALAARLLPVTVWSPDIRAPRRVIGQSKGLVKGASITSRICALR
jgi:predicted nucleic-acid-binding Zn-ribbon protein